MDLPNQPDEPEERPISASFLEPLFARLDLETCKKCRYVCRVWSTKALEAMQDRFLVNISTNFKQKTFLASGFAQNFKGFAFKTHKLDNALVEFFRACPPSSLDTGMDLILKEDENYDNILKIFKENLYSQSNNLVNLTVHVVCTIKRKLSKAESDTTIEFTKLEKLTIISKHHDELTELQGLWISIFSHSPSLVSLDFRNFPCHELWNELSNEIRFCELAEFCYQIERSSEMLDMQTQLVRTAFPVSLQRLSMPFQDAYSGIIVTILSKIAPTLKVLEFFTEGNIPLSLTGFPVMQQLTTFDTGSSHVSLPNIVTYKFPKLTELRTTYWDWIYNKQHIGDIDVHCFWTESAPHTRVTNICIKFPNWTDLKFEFVKLEYFPNFLTILHSKFPSACNFTFENVPICYEIKDGLGNFIATFEFASKTIRISSYYTKGISNPGMLEITAKESSNKYRVLEVLDLCTRDWPEIWRKNPTLMLSISDDWLPNLVFFDKLQVLKLLWTKNIFSLLDLEDKNVLPNLKHLEFVGNLCIDRFDRAAARKSRPNLTIIQHTCYCDCEDWWYMQDEESQGIFQTMFAFEYKRTKGFFQKIFLGKQLR